MSWQREIHPNLRNIQVIINSNSAIRLKLSKWRDPRWYLLFRNEKDALGEKCKIWFIMSLDVNNRTTHNDGRECCLPKMERAILLLRVSQATRLNDARVKKGQKIRKKGAFVNATHFQDVRMQKLEAQFHCKCNSYSKEQKYWAQNTTQARTFPEARNSPILTSAHKSLSGLQKIHECIEQANSTLPRRLLKLPKPWESIVTEFDEYVSELQILLFRQCRAKWLSPKPCAERGRVLRRIVHGLFSGHSSQSIQKEKEKGQDIFRKWKGS